MKNLDDLSIYRTCILKYYSTVWLMELSPTVFPMLLRQSYKSSNVQRFVIAWVPMGITRRDKEPFSQYYGIT